MKLNINLVHHYSITLNRGGEKMIKSMATELIRRGHCVSVYSFPLRRQNTPLSFPFYYKESFSRRLVCDVAYYVYVPLLHKLFPTSAPKIAGIHSFAAFPRFSHEPAGFAKLLLRHGVLTCGATYLNKLTRNRDLNNFNAIHIPNTFNCRNQLDMKSDQKRYPVVYTIPNWVDLQVFKPKGNKSSIFTVLYVGCKYWSKGYDIFLRVAEYLSKKFSNIRFIAVGVQKERNRRSSPLMEAYPFIYKDNVLADVYSSSHILLYPSRADIFGVTLIEAMACGTPVLTSALPSHRAFLPPKFICSTLRDYVYKTIEVYKTWREEPEKYELLVSESRNLASKFDKNELFPLFEKMLFEVANKG
jgi:glycosyltransferase involved in cell wall biosynthesis